MAKQAGPWLGKEIARRLGLDPNYVRRIVLDCARDGAVVAHVEMYADETMIEIVPLMDGVKIVREPKDTEVSIDG